MLYNSVKGVMFLKGVTKPSSHFFSAENKSNILTGRVIAPPRMKAFFGFPV